MYQKSILSRYAILKATIKKNLEMPLDSFLFLETIHIKIKMLLFYLV